MNKKEIDLITNRIFFSFSENEKENIIKEIKEFITKIKKIEKLSKKILERNKIISIKSSNNIINAKNLHLYNDESMELRNIHSNFISFANNLVIIKNIKNEK